MSNFKNTENWEKKNNSTIVYRYESQGKEYESKLCKEPHILFVTVDRISVVERTAWNFADEKRPDTMTDYQAGEYIIATGKLDHSRVHAFFIGEAATVTFNRIEVNIYPTNIDDLRATSQHNRWSILDDEKRPEEGWLKDELGRIDYFEANEYTDEPSLSARLRLDQATFDSLVKKIKNGGTLEKAFLEVLADLFQFGPEGAFAPPLKTKNYGLLCEKKENLTKAYTKARL